MRKPFVSVATITSSGTTYFRPGAGGYGPWRIVRIGPRRTRTFYLCIPMHMTRAELRAQFVWASQRCDRRAYLPSKRFAP